jgi:glutaredoxin
MEVFIFSMKNCTHCKDLKTKLDNVQISFKDFDINEHELFWKEIVKKTGENLVPTVCLYNNQDKQTYIFTPGKDFNNGDEAINIIKKHTL